MKYFKLAEIAEQAIKILLGAVLTRRRIHHKISGAGIGELAKGDETALGLCVTDGLLWLVYLEVNELK